MSNWIRHTLKNLYDEIWGETIDYPVVRRLLAYVIDWIIFFCYSGIIAYPFYRFEIDAFEYPLILTILLTTIYFTWGSCKYSHGQTIGKQIFKIQVVGEQGEFIGIGRSFLRSIPITLVTNFYGILYASNYYQVNSYLSWIIFGTLLFLFTGIIYFGIMNLNRQCLHDVISSTQVTERNSKIRTKKQLSVKLVIGYILVTIVLLFIIWR